MDWFEPLVRQLADLGGWGPVLFVGIYILAAMNREQRVVDRVLCVCDSRR